jgi:hypothetical protein
MNEVAQQAMARGEKIDSAALNRTSTNGTDGVIVSNKRADSYVNTTSVDGTKNHYVNEALSKGQTPTTADTKWAPARASAPEGHSVIVTAETVGSIMSRAGKIANVAGPVMGLAGAIAAARQNPNMGMMEFMYRAAGQYDEAVQLGYLPRVY